MVKKHLASSAVLLFWCLALLLQPLFAEETHGPLPEDHLTRAELEAHLRFIASDELQGRRTGTPGNRVAARYIEEQFRRWGLQPPPSLGSYQQTVPLLLQSPPAAGTIQTPGELFHLNSDFVLLSGSAHLEARTVDAGYGYVDEQQGIDDYSGLEVRDCIVIARFGPPPGLDKESPSPVPAERARPEAKRREAWRRGAVGLIEIYSGRSWSQVVDTFGSPGVRLRSGAGGEGQGEDLFHALLYRPEGSLDTPSLRVDVASFQSSPLESSNVIGIVPGSDPEIKGEYILLTAHYDHVGAGPELPGATAEDSIFNGARDNGMGVVALLAAAESLGLRPARRSVLLLATTGEEQGLLGSTYYVRSPAVPLRQSVFELNTDAAGYSDTSIVTVFGLKRTTSGTLIRHACQRYGLGVVDAPAENKDLYYRSDNLSFALAGIPAVTFSPGFRALDRETLRHYHRPSDEASSDFDFDYLRRFSQAFVATARALAESPVIPDWVEGDDFEEPGKRLDTPSQ